MRIVYSSFRMGTSRNVRRTDPGDGMQITLKYFAQVRQAAEVQSEPVELPEGADVNSAIEKAAQGRPEAFRTLVLDERARVRPSLLLLVNSEPVPRGSMPELKAGDEISVFSPIAGG